MNETAAAVEEMSRSIQGVASTRTTSPPSAEETSSAINETAASIEEVTAQTDSLASDVEQNARSTEQLARSVQSVAQSGQRIAMRRPRGHQRRATGTCQPVRLGAGQGGRRDHAPGQPRRRRGRRQRSAFDAGLRPGQGSMTQSATVIREMGKRANDISSIVDTINLIADGPICCR